MTRSMHDLTVWLAQHREVVRDPDLPIVDPHHHMWDRPPESYQLPEILADIGDGHDVRATVFIQCTAMYRPDGPEALRPVGETEYANGVAAASASGLYGPSRVCAGIVGYADLRLGAELDGVLESHIRAGGSRFRGVRQQAQHHPVIGSLSKATPPADLLRDEDFRAGLVTLGRHGLRFDAFVYFEQLAELAAAADAAPDTPIVLNHIGAPLGIGPYANRRDEVFRTWSQGMAQLAARPNVTVKIGGMGMAAYGFGFADRDRPAPSEELADAWRPYVEACIERFGADRCMFESNFPVDKQSCGYRTLWNAFKHIAEAASADEREALFSGTARRVYALAQ